VTWLNQIAIYLAEIIGEHMDTHPSYSMVNGRECHNTPVVWLCCPYWISCGVPYEFASNPLSFAENKTRDGVQRGGMPDMRYVREDDCKDGGDDDCARDCDCAGYDNFTNWYVKREQKELDSSIDQIV